MHNPITYLVIDELSANHSTSIHCAFFTFHFSNISLFLQLSSCPKVVCLIPVKVRAKGESEANWPSQKLPNRSCFSCIAIVAAALLCVQFLKSGRDPARQIDATHTNSVTRWHELKIICKIVTKIIAKTAAVGVLNLSVCSRWIAAAAARSILANAFFFSFF